MKSLIVLLFIGLLLPAQLFALTCYNCATTDSDDKCADPLNFVTAMRLDTCETSGYCMKTKAGNVITRSCAFVCAEVNSKETGMFCCESDRCNSGNKMYFNYATIILPLLSIFLVKGRF